MKIETVWVVINPGPDSELVDIYFGATPDNLLQWAAGCTSCPTSDYAQRASKPTFYTDESEACEDARRRISARDNATKSAVKVDIARSLDALAEKAEAAAVTQRQRGMEKKAAYHAGRGEAYRDAARAIRERDP